MSIELGDFDPDTVKVRITNPESIQPITKTEEHEPEHFVTSTFVLVAPVSVNVGGADNNTNIQQILELDLTRRDAAFLVGATPIIVCDTLRKAKDPSNTAATIVNPQGAYIPAGGNFSVTGTGPLWAVSTVPATPCMVSCIINRRAS
jgi:hypothetical protein